jgi:anti-anti-sigma factor
VELEAVQCRVPFEALDLATVDDFRRWIHDRIAIDASENAHAAVVLDLGDVEFVMAAGVQALVELDAELTGVGRTLVVAGAAPIVARVLDICGCAERWIAPSPAGVSSSTVPGRSPV